MERIASFSVDHDKLRPGMYISRIDGDVITYEIRMKKPNGGNYLSNGAIHTFEHLFATYVRNSEFAQTILYVGPMGCRTGFYFLTRNTLSQADALALILRTFRFIAAFEGEIPGSTQKECGNFREHDLAGAKQEAQAMIGTLESWSEDQMQYEA